MLLVENWDEEKKFPTKRNISSKTLLYKNFAHTLMQHMNVCYVCYKWPVQKNKILFW